MALSRSVVRGDGWEKEIDWKGPEGTLCAYINVLYLGYSGSYMTAYIC